MASAEKKMCANCRYMSGEGSIIICTNPMHYGLAMRAEEVCDSYESAVVQAAPKKVINRSIGDDVGGEDR